ncbi:MAG: hypothetical protein GAK34_03848 [Delftia tsuruhatensis]|nr:MAG: hypothetical protein GAK34_03848 [Delftia tsuruhatensis]
MSVLPGTLLRMRATCSDTSRSSLSSSPKTLMASCERTPVTISSTRSEIGWDSTICTPGMEDRRWRMSSSISSWVRSDSGSSSTMGSDSLGPAGSAGDSPRPSLETTLSTPGTSATDFIAAISMRMDSSSEMLGTRLICGVSAPSFMVGMKDLPSSGNSPSEPSSSATATASVARLRAVARSSRRR